MDDSEYDQVTPARVLQFWFEEHGPADWFSSSEDFDARVRDAFSRTHAQAVANELSDWRRTPEGRLAEIIVLDQFSRQLYRRQARAFAADGQALALAQELVRRGEDRVLREERRLFAYLPFVHSESLALQEQAVALSATLGEEAERHAREHRALIVRFGRYPHRNAALGRDDTAEEARYLAGIHESYGQ